MGNYKDYTGQKFGRLTAVKFVYHENGKTFWECLCDCGNTKVAKANSLVSGCTKSCGCIRTDDVTGQKFGGLTAIRKTETRNRQAMWEFLCECGTLKSLSLSSVRKGSVVSCGCYRRNSFKRFHQKTNFATVTKHGHARKRNMTSTYTIWAGIRTRCVNPEDTAYQNYGGRGITICDRWKDSFENFLEDMGERPGKEYSIDRIDNEKGYSPDNCKWATRKEQHRNTRRNVWIEFNGQRKVASDWAAEYGISATTLKYRIFKAGWDVEKALTTPPKAKP